MARQQKVRWLLSLRKSHNRWRYFTFFIVTTRPTLNVHFLPAEFLNPADELERGYEEIASVPVRSAAWALRGISCISMGAMALTM